MSSTVIGQRRFTRDELKQFAAPPATRSFRPVPHYDVAQAIVETLGLRGVRIEREDYVVDVTGQRLFGALDLAHETSEVRFSLGLRNSNDKRMRLGMVAGYRVFVCSNMAFSGDFEPVLRKHTSGLDLIETVSLGVDRVIAGFDQVGAQVQRWKDRAMTDDDARVIIYEAFVDGRLEVPPTLLRAVHDLYFKPIYPEFEPRNLWTLSNAFTSAFKRLTGTSQFRATALLPQFLTAYETR